MAVDIVPATQPEVTAEEPNVTGLVDPNPAAPDATIVGAIVALPVAMASRVQALETQDALRAATAMARRRPETRRPDEPGMPPPASPGARP